MSTGGLLGRMFRKSTEERERGRTGQRNILNCESLATISPTSSMVIPSETSGIEAKRVIKQSLDIIGCSWRMSITMSEAETCDKSQFPKRDKLLSHQQEILPPSGGNVCFGYKRRHLGIYNHPPLCYLHPLASYSSAHLKTVSLGF